MDGAAFTIAASPVSWGVDFPDASHVPGPHEFLQLISRIGITGLELGPVGFLPENRGGLRSLLEQYQLLAVGTWIVTPLHDSSATDEILVQTRRTARFVESALGDLLIVIDSVSSERGATAGTAADARRLGSREWTSLLDHLKAVAEIAHEHGLRPVFHPHAGTYVEFDDEIERLVGDTEALDLGLCVDTGHSAYAGISASSLVRRYSDRVAHVHLKDLDEDVFRRARRERLDFWSAVASGVFCRLGTGAADVEGSLASLVKLGYRGYATLEQDRDPSRASPPADDFESSVEFVRATVRRLVDEHGDR
jgi:inosose dehydratase